MDKSIKSSEINFINVIYGYKFVDPSKSKKLFKNYKKKEYLYFGSPSYIIKESYEEFMYALCCTSYVDIIKNADEEYYYDACEIYDDVNFEELKNNFNIEDAFKILMEDIDRIDPKIHKKIKKQFGKDFKSVMYDKLHQYVIPMSNKKINKVYCNYSTRVHNILIKFNVAFRPSLGGLLRLYGIGYETILKSHINDNTLKLISESEETDESEPWKYEYRGDIETVFELVYNGISKIKICDDYIICEFQCDS